MDTKAVPQGLQNAPVPFQKWLALYSECSDPESLLPDLLELIANRSHTPDEFVRYRDCVRYALPHAVHRLLCCSYDDVPKVITDCFIRVLEIFVEFDRDVFECADMLHALLRVENPVFSSIFDDASDSDEEAAMHPHWGADLKVGDFVDYQDNSGRWSRAWVSEVTANMVEVNFVAANGSPMYHRLQGRNNIRQNLTQCTAHTSSPMQVPAMQYPPAERTCAVSLHFIDLISTA